MAETLLARLPVPLARAFALPFAVHARARATAVDQLAAGTAYFAFLALVPVLLLATAVAGFLLDDADAQAAVVSAITSALPGLQSAVEPGVPVESPAWLPVRLRERAAVGRTP